MTEPTREPELNEPGIDEPDAHKAAGDAELDERDRDLRARYGGPDPLPYIKRIPSRRYYDLLLLVPFCCFGASVGTLAIATGFFRHLGLVVACAVLFAWVRAGTALTKEKHTGWLYAMGGLAVVFLACGYLSKFA